MSDSMIRGILKVILILTNTKEVIQVTTDQPPADGQNRKKEEKDVIGISWFLLLSRWGHLILDGQLADPNLLLEQVCS